jgi:hypothetical protein
MPDGPAGRRAVGDEYDALADLFLADGALAPSGTAGPKLRLADEAPPAMAPGASTSSEPGTRAAPYVEGLILGHLPVSGAAWVTQYAKHVADTRRSAVALVRVQGGQTWLDLVLPRGAEPRMSSRIGAGAPAADLRSAMDEAAKEAGAWLIRVDETSEPDLLGLPGLTTVTLLTGADDPAVVASYRTIKNLCQASGPEGDGSMPSLGLAVMGADDLRAADAEAKIGKAARTFLGRPIESMARVGKVGACTTRALFRASHTEPLASLLGMIESLHRSPAACVQASPVVVVPVPEVVPRPVPAATPSPEVPGAAPEGLPGMTMLRTTCPYAAGITLWSGDGGSLHLVGRSGGGQDPGDVVGRLLAAAAWADDHAALLEEAHPGAIRGVSEHGPVLHLVVEDAKGARPLLDTGVRVHLAVRVEIAGQTHTVLRDLN